MARLPDLKDLNYESDPYSEAPDPVEVQQELENLRQWIDTRPPGSMSGGVVFEDEFIDNSNRKYFSDTTQRHGLLDSEKQVLWDTLSPAIMNRSRSEREKEKAISAEADALYAEFKDIAGNKYSHEAISAAASKVNESLRDRGISPRRMLFDNKPMYIQDVIAELGVYDAVGYDTAPATYEEQDYGRTDGISGSGGWQQQQPREPEPGDMIRDLNELKKRSGYY